MFRKIFGDGGFHFRERTYLPGGWRALKMQCHNLMQQRSHTSEEIPVRQPLQGRRGNLGKMAVIGEMKSQMEGRRKGKMEGEESKEGSSSGRKVNN